MNAKYYPLVADLFQKRYPERYHRIPFLTAWSGLWRNAIASPRRGEPDAAIAAPPAGEPQAQPAAAQ
jgi:hypothetical protein